MYWEIFLFFYSKKSFFTKLLYLLFHPLHQLIFRLVSSFSLPLLASSLPPSFYVVCNFFYKENRAVVFSRLALDVAVSFSITASFSLRRPISFIFYHLQGVFLSGCFCMFWGAQNTGFIGGRVHLLWFLLFPSHRSVSLAWFDDFLLFIKKSIHSLDFSPYPTYASGSDGSFG